MPAKQKSEMPTATVKTRQDVPEFMIGAPSFCGLKPEFPI
jgi:hypothetical protein